MASLMVLRSGARDSGTYVRGLKSPLRQEIEQLGEWKCPSSLVAIICPLSS
jgi:hypothetical protein